jgi:pilus assembly protein CpaE
VKTQAFVVADDPVYANWLQTAVATADFSLVRPIDTEDLLSRLEFAGRPELLFIEFHPDNAEQRAAMVESVVERFPDLILVGLGVDNNPALVLAAMRAGARDFFVLRRDEANIAALVGKLLRRTASITPSARGKQGVLAAVMSAHPSDSIAFLAEHLAYACQERLRLKERVLLLDLATPAGATSVFLNLSPTYGVLDAINDVHRCDATLVETAFPKHESGLYVLSLPEELLGRPMVDSDPLLRLIGVLRGLFACTVLAIDGFSSIEVLRAVLAQADRSLLVTDQSILKSRHNKYLLRALRGEDAPMDRVGLVIDNYRHRLGLEPESLAELLGLPLMATLGAHAQTRIQAMNSGETLFKSNPKDPYLVEMRRLAASLVAGQPVEVTEPAAGKGLLGRLFR